MKFAELKRRKKMKDFRTKDVELNIVVSYEEAMEILGEEYLSRVRELAHMQMPKIRQANRRLRKKYKDESIKYYVEKITDEDIVEKEVIEITITTAINGAIQAYAREIKERAVEVLTEEFVTAVADSYEKGVEEAVERTLLNKRNS